MRKHLGLGITVALLIAMTGESFAATTPVPATTETLTVGDLTITHPESTSNNKNIDVFLSIKNASAYDERLGGAETTWKNAGIVLVTKDKSGKEQESPVSQVLPAEKSVEFTKSGTWLRIKDVQREGKSADAVPLTLYFRRSPNAVLKIAANGKASGVSSSLMDWLKR